MVSLDEGLCLFPFFPLGLPGARHGGLVLPKLMFLAVPALGFLTQFFSRGGPAVLRLNSECFHVIVPNLFRYFITLLLPDGGSTGLNKSDLLAAVLIVFRFLFATQRTISPPSDFLVCWWPLAGRYNQYLTIPIVPVSVYYKNPFFIATFLLGT